MRRNAIGMIIHPEIKCAGYMWRWEDVGEYTITPKPQRHSVSVSHIHLRKEGIDYWAVYIHSNNNRYVPIYVDRTSKSRTEAMKHAVAKAKEINAL